MNKTHEIEGQKYSVQFNKRPGKPMFEPKQILRGASAHIHPGRTPTLVDREGTQDPITCIAVVETGSGKGEVQLLSGDFLAGELRFDSYDGAIRFLRGLTSLAECGESGPPEQDPPGVSEESEVASQEAPLPELDDPDPWSPPNPGLT